MKTPTTVYKFPGNDVKVGKEGYVTKVIDAEDLEDAENEGWCCSPQEAKELHQLLKAEEEAKKKKAEEEAKTSPPAFANGGNSKKAPPAPKAK